MSVSSLVNMEKTTHIGKARKKPRFPHQMQYCAALSVSINFMINGVQDGWSGPTLSKLQLSEEEGSWLASSLLLGQILGPALGAIGGHTLGRKRTILLTIFPNLIGSLILAFSSRILFQCLARVLCGLATQAAMTIVPLYIGEISTPTIRGKLTYFLMMAYNVGLLWVYAVGSYTSVQTNSLLLLIFPILFAVTFWWMPESAYYYVLQGNHKKAAQSLQLLRISDNPAQDLRDVILSIDRQTKTQTSWTDLFVLPKNRRALIICLIITNTSIFTGINVLLAYAQPIFDQVEAGFSSSTSSIIFAVTGIFSIGMGSLLIDSWGRRPLLTLSTIATSIPLLAIGVFFYLQLIEYTYISSISFLPVLCFVLVKFSMSLGVSCLSNVCRGELFPSNLSALAACVTETYSSAMRFGLVKIYPGCVDMFGIHVVFWAFGLSCIISASLVWLFVPETKNKSLDQVQKQLAEEGLCVTQCFQNADTRM